MPTLPPPLFRSLVKSSPRRSPGQVWRGQSGRWFTMTPDRRVIPAKAPGSDKPQQTRGTSADDLDFLLVADNAKEAAKTIVLDLVKKAGDLKDRAGNAYRKLLAGVGKKASPQVRKKVRAVAKVVAAVEHKIEKVVSGSQKLVEQVAEERNLPPLVKKIAVNGAKILDLSMRWTFNIPIVHHAIEAAEVAAGPAGFVLAKVGYYLPVGSLAFLAVSTATNPLATLRAAKKLLASTAEHKALDHGGIDESFANRILDLYERRDPELVNAKLAVAVDKTHDAEAALSAAERALSGTKTKALSWLSVGSGGALVKPAKQSRPPKLRPSLFKAYWMTKAKEQRQVGVPFQGNSGRWFIRRQSDGRTVPYKKQGDSGTPAKEPKKQASEKPPAKPKQAAAKPGKPTVDQVKAGISEFVSKGKVEPQSAKVIADSIATLTVVQINDLKKQLGLKGSGTKAQLASKLADQILAKVGLSQPKPAEQSKEQKPELKPTAEQPVEKPVEYTTPDKPQQKQQNSNFPPDDEPRWNDLRRDDELSKTTPKLTGPELASVKAYTSDTDAYKGINAAALGGEASAKDKAAAAALQKAIEQAPPIPPTAVYRGMALSSKDAPAFLQKLDESASTGGTITMRGFSSTSLDPLAAKRFADGTADSVPVMFEIVANRGLYVEPVSEVRGQEFEMILPANSQFRVVGVKELAYGISGEVRKTYQMEQL